VARNIGQADRTFNYTNVLECTFPIVQSHSICMNVDVDAYVPQMTFKLTGQVWL